MSKQHQTRASIMASKATSGLAVLLLLALFFSNFLANHTGVNPALDNTQTHQELSLSAQPAVSLIRLQANNHGDDNPTADTASLFWQTSFYDWLQSVVHIRAWRYALHLAYPSLHIHKSFFSQAPPAQR